jgi:hypothetical protein
VFFIDQALSGDDIPRAITYASGCPTEIFKKHFPIDSEDVDWLPEVGKRGWVLITKDQKIEKRPREKAALLNGKVRAFIILHGNLAGSVIAALIKQAMPKMPDAIGLYEPPFIFGIAIDGTLRPLSDLISKSASSS